MQTFTRRLVLIPYLPHWSASLLGYAIPVIEIALGGALITYGMFAAKLFAILLLAVFSIVAYLAIMKKQRIPCNCFGSNESETLSTKTIMRNGGFILLLIFSLFETSSQISILALVYGANCLMVFLMASKLQHVLQLAKEGVIV